MSTSEKEGLLLRSQRLHAWKTPFTMCLCMMGGVGFAVVHHCFYGSLDGTEPSSDTYRAFGGTVGGASSQQLNIALGTLLAPMAKILLSMAISTAQEQHAWRVLKTCPSKLRAIDGLLTSKSNFSNIMDGRLWLRYPLSMFLSLLFWLLPFAPLLTPATLTVKAVIARGMIVGPVPSINFDIETFARFERYISGIDQYLGPSDTVSKAVLSSLISGTIVPMSSAHSNASWSLDFEGPALQCSALDVDDELHINITESARELCFVRGYCFQYVAWMPESPTNISPFQTNGTTTIPSKVSGPRDAAPSIFVAEREKEQFSLSGSYFDSFTRCTLYRALHHAEFTYRSGVQETRTTTKVTDPSEPWVGGVGRMSSTLDTSRGRIGVAFQAVMDAFSSMLIGTANFNRNNQGNVFETQVGMTPLAERLRFFENPTGNKSEGGTAIPSLLEEMFRNTTLSLVTQARLIPSEPLQASIETQAYRNVYTYSVTALWIAYGVAVGIIVSSIAIGTRAVAAAGSLYSSKFSTILRLASNVRLSEYLEPRDAEGGGSAARSAGKHNC